MQVETEKEESEPKVTGLQWYKKLYRTYDRTFLTAMAVIYFVQGFKTFVDLSIMDLFK